MHIDIITSEVKIIAPAPEIITVEGKIIRPDDGIIGVDNEIMRDDKVIMKGNVSAGRRLIS